MSKQIKFGFSNELMCPFCGGPCLHQESCTAYWRAADAETGIACRSSESGVSTKTGMEGNPSSRRDGFRMTFSCEMCPAEPVLTIFQHKGSTFLEWE